jgi:hypothetical protein
LLHQAYISYIPIGNHEVNRPFEKPRCRLEDNTGMSVRETGCKVVYCTHLIQDRPVVVSSFEKDTEVKLRVQ